MIVWLLIVIGAAIALGLLALNEAHKPTWRTETCPRGGTHRLGSEQCSLGGHHTWPGAS